jgi:cytochrome b561
MRAGNNIEGGSAYPATNAIVGPAYTMTARVLHWTTAFLILSMIPLGIVIANEWGGSAQDFLYDLHRSIGAAIIPLIFLRLIYRWTHPPLPLPDDIPELQRLAAHATHWGLYALLIVQPFTGWIATSAYQSRNSTRLSVAGARRRRAHGGRACPGAQSDHSGRPESYLRRS